MATPKTPDLTKSAPRSPRVRLGGYAILPRMLDKGRAAIAHTQGEYKYACPLDQRFLEFAGIDADALKKQLAARKSDGEILAWIQKHSKTKPSPEAIAAWSAHQDQRVPSEPGSRQFFNEIHSEIGPKREDIATWFDLLDLDDYVSFGGQA
ncbi:MAG: DUF5069 domain-containing protein [Limisphaerales bacterium]